MKDIRIKVTTADGLCTIWYERSKAKNATEIINKRVYNQLCGLNIKEIDVSVIGDPVTVWQVSTTPCNCLQGVPYYQSQPNDLSHA